MVINTLYNSESDDDEDEDDDIMMKLMEGETIARLL
jgi:hypothetical protein